ncbi:MAG TPA: ATP-binding protein, partial [Thermoanaerobaculia bacterium]|nr:ATP-binding protein [Thermoanaerobaculia bacterium]
FDQESRLELVNRAGERLLANIGIDALLALDESSTVEWHGTRWSVRVSSFRREGTTHRLLVVADISRALRQEEIRAWQRVVRVLGHELNNSLAPIKSIAGTLEESIAHLAPPLQTNLTRGLGVISRRADALARFLSGYSELARLPEPTLRAVDLGAVVRRVAALDARVIIEEGPPAQVEADEDQLEQVLINLTKNAIDAGGRAFVAWRLDGFLVGDEGPGLASTANLFVPFFTTKPGGSGIGLVLSRQIVEAHGGTLTLRNREDGIGCEAVVGGLKPALR